VNINEQKEPKRKAETSDCLSTAWKLQTLSKRDILPRADVIRRFTARWNF